MTDAQSKLAMIAYALRQCGSRVLTICSPLTMADVIDEVLREKAVAKAVADSLENPPQENADKT